MAQNWTTGTRPLAAHRAARDHLLLAWQAMEANDTPAVLSHARAALTTGTRSANLSGTAAAGAAFAEVADIAEVLTRRKVRAVVHLWRELLEHRPDRSLQLRATLGLMAFSRNGRTSRTFLRLEHAACRLGHEVEPRLFRAAYSASGVEASIAFDYYLTVATTPLACLLGPGRELDPLTGRKWAMDDGSWWRAQPRVRITHIPGFVQREALSRASHLALTAHDYAHIGQLSLQLEGHPTGSSAQILRIPIARVSTDHRSSRRTLSSSRRKERAAGRGKVVPLPMSFPSHLPAG